MRFEEIVERFLKRVDGEVTEKKIKEVRKKVIC